MADDAQRPIIVRRKKKKGGGGGHGGAWKIAYADFVTAMMAFFLLMWLLGSTAKGDLNGISDYFKTPLKVAMQGGSGAGDATSIIKGGGQDLSRSDGQRRRGESNSPTAVAKSKPSSEYLRQEALKFKELKLRMETAIERNPQLRQFKNQLLLDITSEGLRVQIVDDKNRPMFAIGRAELQPYARDILIEIGKTLNDVDNKVSLAGHTDATPYASGEKGYSNWELSADRANASRRVLLAGGMDERRVVRVVGMASAAPLDKDDPQNAMNRRISLIVMNRDTAQAVQGGGAPAPVEASSAEDIKPALQKNAG
jgi:chemotaxis protein MotB